LVTTVTLRFAGRSAGISLIRQTKKPTTGLEHFPDCSLNAGVMLGALRQTCEHVD